MTYQPDPSSLPILGGIAAQLQAARTVSHSFRRPPKMMAVLPNGDLYFDSTLELDTDGWPDGRGRGDATWQRETSLGYRDGSYINANTVPYFVLPLPVAWPAQFGIRIGDYAAVIYKDRISFAVFADFGDNPGEGSIELLRRLGRERIRPDGTVINSGMGPGVITIVFPGSRPGGRLPDEASLKAAVEAKGRQRFVAAGGGADGAHSAAAVSGVTPPPPGLGERIAQKALQEYADYGSCPEDQLPLRQRIHEYWQLLNESYDGSSDQPWSAAFISFMVHLAEGDSTLALNGQHSRYVHRAIVDRHAERQGRFWAYRPAEIPIAQGDILAMNRGTSRPIDFEQARASDDFPSHCDIVTTVGQGRLETVGGNVGAAPGTVGKKVFRWSQGALVNAANPRQRVYAVLRPPPV